MDTQKPSLGQTWGRKSIFWKKIDGCSSLDLSLRGSHSSSSKAEKEELPAGRHHWGMGQPWAQRDSHQLPSNTQAPCF